MRAGHGKEKKKASQCRGNVGILELKQTERSYHFRVKSVAEKGEGEKR